MTGALDRTAQGAECRHHSSDARAQASKATDPEMKLQWLTLAEQYAGLAQQWEQNRALD
jgi:hypothetical protein